MVGGKARARAPRDLTANPDLWPDTDLTGHLAGAAIQDIARALAEVIARDGWSLRRLAAVSGVNRQVIADLLAGRSWPDVATVARLGHAVGEPLWPGQATSTHDCRR